MNFPARAAPGVAPWGLAQAVVHVHQGLVALVQHLQVGGLGLLGHPGAAVQHEVALGLAGLDERGGHEGLGDHVPGALGLDPGGLPQGHLLAVGAGVVPPGKDRSLAPGQGLEGLHGAPRPWPGPRGPSAGPTMKNSLDPSRWRRVAQPSATAFFSAAGAWARIRSTLRSLNRARASPDPALYQWRRTGGFGGKGLHQGFQEPELPGAARGQVQLRPRGPVGLGGGSCLGLGQARQDHGQGQGQKRDNMPSRLIFSSWRLQLSLS